MWCFQILELTALLVKGPSELHPVFTVSPNGVAIDDEKVMGAVVSVQDFVRHPLSTQSNFFCLRLGSACWTLLSLPQMLFATMLNFTLGEQLVKRLAPYLQFWSRAERKLYHDGRGWEIHGSVGLVPKPLPHQLLVRLHRARLSASLISLM